MTEEKTRRETEPKLSVQRYEQDLGDERQALRRLIDTFSHQPRSGDDSGFYRNIGRLIARPMMKSY